MTILFNESQGIALANAIANLPQIENVSLFRYFDLGDYIRVYNVDPSTGWLFKEAKPSFLLAGRYVQFSHDMLVSKNSTLKADVGSILANVTATLHKGEKLTIFTDGVKIEFNIVGEIADKIVAPGKLKLFVRSDAFEELHDEFAAATPIYCYSIAALVKGPIYNPFNNDIYNNKMALDDPDEPLSLLTTNTSYGLWSAPDPGNPDAAKKDRATRFLYFFIGIGGGIILTILYNFLIVWFRKREVAVLRALGYEKGEIRINLIGESLTISFLGYTIGILGIIVYYLAQGMTFTNQLLSIWALLASFAIVVLISIPGLLLSSLSFVKVSPIILFKGR